LAACCLGAWWWWAAPSRDRETRTAVERAALHEVRQRAERGDAPAQMELAERYCQGKGVRKNVFQCAEWYRKAANLGFGAAMLRLGDLYATGEGFILDKEAAGMWWRKAEATADGADGAKTRLRRLGVDTGVRQ
jgi:TPR repeat protein